MSDMADVQLMDDVVEGKSAIAIPGVGTVNATFLQIDENDLGDALEKQAGYYAFWSVAVADAERESAQSALAVKVVCAEVRRELKEEGGKMTVPDLNAAVDENEKVLAAKLAAIDAEYRASMTKAIMYALQQKKDMLSSKTGLRRSEMDLHMKELGVNILTGGKT